MTKKVLKFSKWIQRVIIFLTKRSLLVVISLAYSLRNDYYNFRFCVLIVGKSEPEAMNFLEKRVDDLRLGILVFDINYTENVLILYLI